MSAYITRCSALMAGHGLLLLKTFEIIYPGGAPQTNAAIRVYCGSAMLLEFFGLASAYWALHLGEGRSRSWLESLSAGAFLLLVGAVISGLLEPLYR